MDVERREGEKGDASMDAEVCVNWRGKPCETAKHGGMKAAVFVLGPPSLSQYLNTLLTWNNSNSGPIVSLSQYSISCTLFNLASSVWNMIHRLVVLQ
jgi:hypothetical protein